MAPAVDVFRLAVLDGSYTLVKLLRHGPNLSVRAETEGLLYKGLFKDRLHIDMRQWRDNHRCPASSSLLERLKFLKTDWPFLNGHPKVSRNLLKGLVGNGRQDAVR